MGQGGAASARAKVLLTLHRHIDDCHPPVQFDCPRWLYQERLRTTNDELETSRNSGQLVTVDANPSRKHQPVGHIPRACSHVCLPSCLPPSWLAHHRFITEEATTRLRHSYDKVEGCRFFLTRANCHPLPLVAAAAPSRPSIHPHTTQHNTTHTTHTPLSVPPPACPPPSSAKGVSKKNFSLHGELDNKAKNLLC